MGVYDTTKDMITGVGLEADGTLLPGGTYQVLANEILGGHRLGRSVSRPCLSYAGGLHQL